MNDPFAGPSRQHAGDPAVLAGAAAFRRAAARQPRPRLSELRCADFVVRRGNNAQRLGIAALHARLEAGTLKILESRCPNLLAETNLYRYSDDPDDRRAETPVDDHNHALGALRYLVSRLDERKMAMWKSGERRELEGDSNTGRMMAG